MTEDWDRNVRGKTLNPECVRPQILRKQFVTVRVLIRTCGCTCMCLCVSVCVGTEDRWRPTSLDRVDRKHLRSKCPVGLREVWGGPGSVDWETGPCLSWLGPVWAEGTRPRENRRTKGRRYL